MTLLEPKSRYIIDRHLLQSMGRLCTDQVSELIQEDYCGAIYKKPTGIKTGLAEMPGKIIFGG